MSVYELPTEATIGSAEVKVAQRGRFLYAAVTLQITPNRPSKGVEYQLGPPEELDEYHCRAVRTTEIPDVKEALEKGIACVLEEGVEGVPLTNCQVVVLQVIRSVGESSMVALTAAAAKAVRKALRKSAPHAFEEGKDFEDWLWIDFDEKANRWNLHLSN